ncbi:MAG: hypothetical protein NE328_17965 [Lentisphaeraceae bacterium]|nr:hypothetical protein [Lentisphaeraceae bacterium]
MKSIKELKNQTCWAVIAGKGTGSIINLKIGKKTPMSKPLTNPHLSEDARNYKSKFGIMVWSSWELTQGSKVICNSEDSNENDGPMVMGLKNIENQKVEDITTTEHFHELDIYFTGNYKLEVFCDGKDIDEDYDNYTIYLPTESLTVEANYKIKKEKL